MCIVIMQTLYNVKDRLKITEMSVCKKLMINHSYVIKMLGFMMGLWLRVLFKDRNKNL